MATNLKQIHRGFTAVEALMVLAVASCTLGATLPGLRAAVERKHVEGAAAQLVTDIQLTRSTAVASVRQMRLRVMNVDGGSCYVIHTGSAGDCRCSHSGPAQCVPGAMAFRSASFPAGSPFTLSSNAQSMLFEPDKGTVTPTSTVRLLSPSGSLNVVTNIMGRARTCSPNGRMPGYTAC